MQSYQPFKDLRILLISSTRIHEFGSNTDIAAYFHDHTNISLHAYDPDDMHRNASEFLKPITQCSTNNNFYKAHWRLWISPHECSLK